MYLKLILFLVMILTLSFVVLGLVNTLSTKKVCVKRSNKLMMMRVAAQAVSILILFVIWFVYKV